MRQVTGTAAVVRYRAVFKLCRSNLSLQFVMACEAQLGGRFTQQVGELGVVRSVTLDASQSFRHGLVLELARLHILLDFLVAPVET